VGVLFEVERVQSNSFILTNYEFMLRARGKIHLSRRR
jgi:hypothetical protein